MVKTDHTPSSKRLYANKMVRCLVATQKTTRVKKPLLGFNVRVIQHVYTVHVYRIVSLAKKALSV